MLVGVVVVVVVVVCVCIGGGGGWWAGRQIPVSEKTPLDILYNFYKGLNHKPQNTFPSFNEFWEIYLTPLPITPLTIPGTPHSGFDLS